MEWADVVSGIVQLLISIVTFAFSIVIAPLDLLINAFIPQATAVVQEFFGFLQSLLAQFNDFLMWFLYVTGMQPSTWALIMLVMQLLLLCYLTLLPIKMIMGVLKGTL